MLHSFVKLEKEYINHELDCRAAITIKLQLISFYLCLIF